MRKVVSRTLLLVSLVVSGTVFLSPAAYPQ